MDPRGKYGFAALILTGFFFDPFILGSASCGAVCFFELALSLCCHGALQFVPDATPLRACRQPSASKPKSSGNNLGGSWVGSFDIYKAGEG
jgi:hypothetical protein